MKINLVCGFLAIALVACYVNQQADADCWTYTGDTDGCEQNANYMDPWGMYTDPWADRNCPQDCDGSYVDVNDTTWPESIAFQETGYYLDPDLNQFEHLCYTARNCIIHNMGEPNEFCGPDLNGEPVDQGYAYQSNININDPCDSDFPWE